MTEFDASNPSALAPAIDLNINTDLARTILTGFIRSEIHRAGFQRAVLGVSGGVDSTLSCYLAAEALGPENVLALRMPYKSSSADSLEHAQMVIDRLGVQSLTIPITEMVDPLFERIPDMNPVRRGNVMARARMIILYDQSEAFRGLVVGTGNKTEILLGYTTLFGDSACALNPLGDLYKTQVRQLSRAIGVPEAIVAKLPSADLWVGQTDEGELGFTYAEVDRLLYLLVDQRYSPQECAAAGFDEKFVRLVVERVRRFHFKRVMPPIAKLSNRTVGYDFLYLRDWGT
jgi:NAD+ synthase